MHKIWNVLTNHGMHHGMITVVGMVAAAIVAGPLAGHMAGWLFRGVYLGWEAKDMWHDAQARGWKIALRSAKHAWDLWTPWAASVGVDLALAWVSGV